MIIVGHAQTRGQWCKCIVMPVQTRIFSSFSLFHSAFKHPNKTPSLQHSPALGLAEFNGGVDELLVRGELGRCETGMGVSDRK